MMRELTGKVINLLDDPSLEAVKVRTVALVSSFCVFARCVCCVAAWNGEKCRSFRC